MEIRRLTESDAQAVWDLRRTALTLEPEAFGESLDEHLRTSVETLAGRLQSGGDENFVLGATCDSTLAGMVGFYRDLRKKRRHRSWIWGMFVAPDWRQRGLGRQLMEEALSRARQIAGVRYVMLSVTQDSARRLYASIGFQSFGIEPGALQVNGRLIDEEHMLLRF